MSSRNPPQHPTHRPMIDSFYQLGTQLPACLFNTSLPLPFNSPTMILEGHQPVHHSNTTISPPVNTHPPSHNLSLNSPLSLEFDFPPVPTTRLGSLGFPQPTVVIHPLADQQPTPPKPNGPAVGSSPPQTVLNSTTASLTFIPPEKSLIHCLKSSHRSNYCVILL